MRRSSPTRTGWRPWLLGLAVVSLLTSQRALAISPSYIMFYGDELSAPVLLRMDVATKTEFLWGTLSRHEGKLDRSAISKQLNGRRYLNFAVFWGRWADPPVRPADASQHGRFYLPTASEPAAVVATFPNMQAADPSLVRPPAAPIPADLGEHSQPAGSFVAGWILNSEELESAKRLGVPRL